VRGFRIFFSESAVLLVLLAALLLATLLLLARFLLAALLLLTTLLLLTRLLVWILIHSHFLLNVISPLRSLVSHGKS
jgi:hypothetical protein